MRHFLANPFILALLITIITIIIIPWHHRYKLEQVKHGMTNKPGSYVSYFDLDGNDTSEKFILFNNTLENAAVKIENDKGGMSGWHNFRGKALTHFCLAADYDHDGLAALYFLTTSNDSVYINALEATRVKDSYTTSGRFLTTIWRAENRVDYSAYGFMTDLQNDKFLELCFGINAGYSLQPRRLFVYDIHHDTILQGPVMGCVTRYKSVNLDNDPFPEFLGSSSSTDNIPDSLKIPFSDSSSWLVALDHDLRFLFPPPEFPGHKTSFTSTIIIKGDSVYILGLFEFNKPAGWKPALYLFNIAGHQLAGNQLSKNSEDQYYNLVADVEPNDYAYISDMGGNIWKTTTDLQLRLVQVKRDKALSYMTSLDCDGDGAPEILAVNMDDNKLLVYRDGFKDGLFHPQEISRGQAHFSVQKTGKTNRLLFLQQDEREYWYLYGKNKGYYLQVLIWLAVYLVILMLVFLARWQQRQQMARQQDMADELTGLQIAILSRHLDTHFMFNTLNTVSSLIFNENREDAHRTFTRFTQLIRYGLDHSKDYAVSLGGEVEFLKSYLDIQKMRYNEAFDYSVTIGSDVDLAMNVPKMILQQYAENAVKHALRHRKSGGELSISICTRNKETLIIIRDNGSGGVRVEAELPGSGTGLAAMEKIYELFGSLEKTIIRHDVHRLESGKGETGTEVVISVQMEVGRRE